MLKCYVKSTHKKFQQKTVYFSLLQKFLFFLLVLHFTYCAWLTENKLNEIKIEFITFLLESATPVFSPWVSKVQERNLTGIIVHVLFFSTSLLKLSTNQDADEKAPSEQLQGIHERERLLSKRNKKLAFP